MKNIATYFMMFVVVAFVVAGCSHGGQVTIPDGNGEVSIESMTDSTGASLEGATIDPGKTIIVTFTSAVASVTAYMACDGDAVDLDVIPIAANQFGLFPKAGRFPQKTTCVLNVNALGASVTNALVSPASASVSTIKSFSTETFDVGCDVLDTFDNLKTLDRTASSLAYGSGCWKMNLVEVPIDNYLMPGGLLEVDGATGAGEFDFNKYPFVAKKVSGDTYTAMLEIADIVERFPEIVADDKIRIYLFLSPNVFTFYDDPPSFPDSVSIAVELFWDEGVGQTAYVMRVLLVDGVEVVAEAEEDIGHFDDVPYVGFIKTGNIVTPFFSVDSGVTKWFFDIDGSSSVDVSQYFGGSDSLDIGISVIAEEHLTVATVFVDALDVVGDVSFVAE